MPSPETPSSKGPESKIVTIRLPRDLHERAQAKADEDNRTFSNYIMNLIARSLDDDDAAADLQQAFREAMAREKVVIVREDDVTTGEGEIYVRRRKSEHSGESEQPDRG